jgi:hypothetical protein
MMQPAEPEGRKILAQIDQLSTTVHLLQVAGYARHLPGHATTWTVRENNVPGCCASELSVLQWQLLVSCTVLATEFDLMVARRCSYKKNQI